LTFGTCRRHVNLINRPSAPLMECVTIANIEHNNTIMTVYSKHKNTEQQH
jgi:hypothetical protein